MIKHYVVAFHYSNYFDYIYNNTTIANRENYIYVSSVEILKGVHLTSIWEICAKLLGDKEPFIIEYGLCYAREDWTELKEEINRIMNEHERQL